MPFVSYAQNFEDVTLWRALKDTPPGFYIDVGAWDPDIESVTLAFSQRGWRGINVEPVPHRHARLALRRPRDINLCLAVGPGPGIIDFFDVAETGLSTTNKALADRYANEGRKVECRTTPVSTLASLCGEHAPGPIHFLKLDCEGDEHGALLGADFRLFRPWIVLAEATEPLSQAPAYAAWEPILLEAAYQFAWFDGLNRFYVAAEHAAELLPRLAQPPNYFDFFVRAADALPWPTPTPKALPAFVPGLPAARPPVLSSTERIALAQRCRDCDELPKVADAGLVLPEPDETAVQIMHNGLKLAAGGEVAPWMTQLITRCSGHYRPQEERVFHDVVRLLPPDATMVELGAGWAYFSSWFLLGAPSRRAIVLEPDPLSRAIGERTMAINGQQAVFVAGFAGAASMPPAPFETKRSGTLLIPCYAVPRLMDDNQIEHLDVLRCDAQGAELMVLEGCRDLFRSRRIGSVFVSTHAPAISSDPIIHDRCLDLLRSCGAVIEAEHDAYESFSGDGLILARFGAAPEGWRVAPTSRARRNEAVFRDPSFDLAEAWTARSIGEVGDGPHSTPLPSLAAPLARYGTVIRNTYSQLGTVGRIGGCPVLQSDGAAGIYLLYGPYCPAEAGRYECTFLIRIEAASIAADAPVLRFDLARDAVPDTETQTCHYGDLVPGEFVPVHFTFDLPHLVTRLETRLFIVQSVPITAVAAVALRRIVTGHIDVARGSAEETVNCSAPA